MPITGVVVKSEVGCVCINAKEMYELLKRYHEESRFVYGEDYDEVEDLLDKIEGE